MATIYKRGKKWHALIRRKGLVRPMDKSFTHKELAEKWARKIETKIDNGIIEDDRNAGKVTMNELFERYAKETANIKRNARHEKYGLRLLSTTFGRLPLNMLSRDKVAKFRNERLAKVKPSTVRNNMHLLSAVISMAMSDWGYDLPYNPVHRVKKPAVNNARNRRLEGNEEKRLLEGAAQHRNPLMKSLIVAAIETGMRLGELLSLEWKHIDYEGEMVFLEHTKNGSSRSVPLTALAMKELQSIEKIPEESRVFHSWKSVHSFQHAWQRLLKRTGINNLHFHDLRHEAASRFSESGMDIMRISAITGHRSLQMLKRYTHFRPKDLARELNERLPQQRLGQYIAQEETVEITAE